MLLYYLFKNEVVSKKNKIEKKNISIVLILNIIKNDIAVFSHQQVNALMVTGAICILFLVAALFAMFALVTVNIYIFYKTSKLYLTIVKYSNIYIYTNFIIIEQTSHFTTCTSNHVGSCIYIRYQLFYQYYIIRCTSTFI